MRKKEVLLMKKEQAAQKGECTACRKEKQPNQTVGHLPDTAMSP